MTTDPSHTTLEHTGTHGGVSSPTSGRLLLAGIMLLVGYAAWALGGTYPPWQWPLWILAGSLLFLLIFPPGHVAVVPSARHPFRRHVLYLLRDPVFYTGLGLLALLSVQWWNAGRPLEYDAVQKLWYYRLPRIPWLPGAFTHAEAREMLLWFFPAWVVVLALRSPLFPSEKIYTLWTLMVLNAALLALFGIIQFVSGTERILGVRPVQNEYFFASFGYINHAGMFFCLMLFLAGGLWFRDLFSQAALKLGVSFWAWGGAILLLLSGATLSFSRAAILLAWGGVIGMVVYVLVRGWPHLTPSSRVKLTFGLVGIIGLTFFLVASFGRQHILRELASLQQGSPLALFEGQRGWLLRSAAAIWREAPWFGVGGWGFRYLVPLHLPAELQGYLLGLANVHNDLLQFLAEFGIVGVGCMVGTVVLLVRPLWRHGVARRPALQFGMIGVCITMVHSNFDLPFRCPAILLTWLVILAGAGRRSEHVMIVETTPIREAAVELGITKE